MADITSEDRERVKLLTLISSSKNEFDKLSLEQLARLQELLEKKDYDLPVSENLGANGLYLPLGNHVSKSKQEFITESLTNSILNLSN